MQFFTSSMVILALASLFSVAAFPDFIHSTLDPSYSVNLENARSSQNTLRDHADHCGDWDALRDQLHMHRVLDLSRQSEAGSEQLLAGQRHLGSISTQFAMTCGKALAAGCCGKIRG